MHELIALVRENNIPMRNGPLLKRESAPRAPWTESIVSKGDEGALV